MDDNDGTSWKGEKEPLMGSEPFSFCGTHANIDTLCALKAKFCFHYTQRIVLDDRLSTLITGDIVGQCPVRFLKSRHLDVVLHTNIST